MVHFADKQLAAEWSSRSNTYGKNPQPTNHHTDTTTEQLQELLTIISNFME